MLTRHIAKENNAVYNFGAENLPKEIMDRVNLRSEEFEKEAEEKGTQEYYLNLLSKLEEKYYTNIVDMIN